MALKKLLKSRKTQCGDNNLICLGQVNFEDKISFKEGRVVTLQSVGKFFWIKLINVEFIIFFSFLAI